MSLVCLLIFVRSIGEKMTKYFLGPLNVSFGLFVKRKAEIDLETFQRDGRLCSRLSHH